MPLPLTAPLDALLPAAPGTPMLADDLAACRASLAANSKTFHAASLLLPARVCAPACVLYGFCRLADDTVDVEGGRMDAVAHLRARLDRVYAGQPQAVPADRALAAVVVAHHIPRELPEFLIEGLAWDVEGRSYDSLDDLQGYAARVAGAVGAMMSLLMGARSAAALARACDLGVAMQLSNIARDVAEDARMGRLYLPRRWMRDAGIDPDAWLQAPRFDEALASVVQRLLAAADALYARAGAGVSELPLDCRPGINAARFLYAAIGHRVGQRLNQEGAASLRQRAVVPGWHKARLLLRAALALWPDASRLNEPPLPVHRSLLDAVAASVPPTAGLANLPHFPDGPAEFVIRLFERLERQERRVEPDNRGPRAMGSTS